MKVILLKDVPNVGRRHDVKEVAPGFARNVLFRQGACEEATVKALARLEMRKAAHESEERERETLLAKSLESLDGKSIRFLEPANEQGHLFGSIHQDAIAAMIESSYRVDLPADAIVLPEPIKTTGDHHVVIALGGKKATIVVSVEPRS